MASDYRKLVAQASQALASKDWDKLASSSQTLIESYPFEPDGYALQGQLAKLSARPNIAISLFTKALELAPSRYDAAIELAEQLVTVKENGQALSLIDRYEKVISDSPRYLNSAGTSLVGIGLIDRAIPLFKKATQLQPDIQLFKANLASALVYAGDVLEAEALYRNLLAENPHHQRNHYQLARVATAKNFDHVEAMKTSISQNSQPDQNNIFIYYALGKELEDLSQWDEAFYYYKKAGDAATRAANYDLTEDLAYLEASKASCNTDWITKTNPAADTAAPTPIFILGLPRTGSTLLERMLSSHSHIHSLGETQFLPISVRLHSGVASTLQLTPEMITGASNADPNNIQKEYLNRIQYRLKPTEYFIEKLPYNSLFVGIIKKSFPNSKIIIVDRDPIDSCFSMYKQPFTWAYKYSYNLENLANYYLSFQELMQHWKINFGEEIYSVKYESLVTAPTETIRDTLNYLQLDFEPACTNPEENKNASTTASSVQVREKLYTSSIKKWEKFENHLRPLIEVLGR